MHKIPLLFYKNFIQMIKIGMTKPSYRFSAYRLFCFSYLCLRRVNYALSFSMIAYEPLYSAPTT